VGVAEKKGKGTNLRGAPKCIGEKVARKEINTDKKNKA